MKENEFGHLVPFNLKKEIPYTTNTVVQRTIVDKASRIVQLMAFDYGKVLAITSDGTQFHVLIEGKAEMVIVETGISDFENIEILKGLSGDENVVKGPFIAISQKLKDGSAIEIKEDKRGGEDNKSEVSVKIEF